MAAPTIGAEAERALTGVRPLARAHGWAHCHTPNRWQLAVHADLRGGNEDGRWPVLRPAA